MAQTHGNTTNENEAESIDGEVAAPPAMSVAEAGRKGGRTTAQRRGPDFYRAIGRKGGVATAEAHGRDFYSEIGRKGGETRADDPDVRSGALGRKGALARWGSGDEIGAVLENGSATGATKNGADTAAASKSSPKSGR